MKRVRFLVHFVILSVICTLVSTGCYYDVEENLYPSTMTCDTSVVTYSNDVLPIISNNCFACHKASLNLGNVSLEPYSALRVYALNGTLGCVISHNPGCFPMPKNNPKLTDCEILKIQTWIDSGAPDN